MAFYFLACTATELAHANNTGSGQNLNLFTNSGILHVADEKD
jgi:hypothetical protein